MKKLESYSDGRKQSEYPADTMTPELVEWLRLQLYQGREIILQDTGKYNFRCDCRNPFVYQVKPYYQPVLLK